MNLGKWFNCRIIVTARGFVVSKVAFMRRLPFGFVAVGLGLSVLAAASPVSAASSANTITTYLISSQSPLTFGHSYPDGVLVGARDSARSAMTLTATGLPPGMTLSTECPSTSLVCEAWIAGTPTQVDSYTLQVTATDTTGATSTLAVPVVVDDAVTITATAPEPDYATIGASVSVPVTATSAAGEALDFTATGLPPGLSLTSTGTTTAVITGTPTTAGVYQPEIVAANPLGGKATTAMTWFVHGTIAVKHQGNLTSTAGTSGIIDIGATDSIKSAQLEYYATGLPPGLIQSGVADSSPLFSGWLTKAGTYHVTLHAYDNYQATASVSFTWTVRAAASSGPTGVIRLAYRSSCVDGNGTKVQVWTCNGGYTQRWMLAQDWTVRLHGECLAETGTKSGSRVTFTHCNGSTAQQWEMQGSPQGNPELTNLASGRCLNDPGYSTRNGTLIDITSCDASPGQSWILPAEQIESQIPGMCLADPGNKTANGTRIVFWQCNGWHEEAFTFEPDSTIRINGKCLADYRGSTANGTALVLEPCAYQKTAEMWVYYPFSPVWAGGALQNWNGNAVGINANTASNGTPVGLYISGLGLGLVTRVR